MNLLELTVTVLADNQVGSTLETVKEEAEEVEQSDPEVEATAEDEASDTLEDVEAEADEVDSSDPEVEISADDNATDVLEDVEATADEVDSNDVEIDVECDTDEANDGLNNLADSGLSNAITSGNLMSDAIELVVDKLGELASMTLTYGDDIDKQSQKIGVSTDFYQTWSNILQHCGSDISTLRPAMKTLSKQAQDGSEDFDKLGISMSDVKNLSKEELFEQVISGLQDMEEGTERTKIASDLLGKGATDMGALFNLTADDTQDLKDKVNDLGLIMDDDAIQASVDYQDSMTDLTQKLQTVFGELAEKLLPKLSEFIDKITEFVNSEEFQSFLDWFVQVAPYIVGVVGAITGLVTVYKTLKTTQELLTIAQWLLNAAMDANPIGVIITLIGLLVTAFVLLWQNCDGFREFWQNLWDNICNIVSTVVGAIVDFFKNLPANIMKIFNNVKDTVTKFVKKIGETVGGIFDKVKDVFLKVIDYIKGLPGKMIEMAKNIIQGLIDGIKNMGQQLWDAIVGIVSDAFNGILSFFGIASPSKLMKGVGVNIIEGLEKGVESENRALTQAFAESAQSAVDAAEDVFDTLTADSFESAIESISSSFRNDLQKSMDGASAEMVVNADEKNNDTVDAIQQQNELIRELSDKLDRFGVYIDGKSLVGEIRGDMQSAIGWSESWSATV